MEGIIRDFIVNMRQDRKLSPSTVPVRIAAIAHFFEMNDVDLRWKKLKKFKGKFRNIIEDKPYTREQIKKLIDRAVLRDKATIALKFRVLLISSKYYNIFILDQLISVTGREV